MAGRARGRARAVPPPATGPDGRPLQMAPRPGAPQPAGPPPGAPSFSAAAAGRSGRSQPPPQPSRGETHQGPQSSAPSLAQQMERLDLSGNGNGGNGNGNGAGSIGRGSLRGARQAGFRTGEIELFRPKSFQTKKGTKGNPVTVCANYFRVKSQKPDEKFKVYHYNVSFAPEQDVIIVRKKLVSQFRESHLGSWYLFDGASLFCFRKVCDKGTPLTLTARKHDSEDVVQLTIRNVGEINSNDILILQIFSILMRRCMENLNLKPFGVRREYYDLSPQATLSIPRHSVDLVPGYVASIRQQEQDLFLCVGVRHKVIRRDTVLDFFVTRRKEIGNDQFRLSCQDLVNATVVTKYNNETYRIDDIAWDKNPLSDFPKRDGTGNTTYVNYYKERYNIEIRNTTQPLLISRPTKRDRRRDQAEAERRKPLLVPELCYMTGISDSMRNDFTLKREMLNHTSLEPKRLSERYHGLIQKFSQNEQIMADIDNWGLEFEKRMVEFQTRCIDEQKLFMRNVEVPAGRNADWGQFLKSNAVERPAVLQRWVVICTNQDRQVGMDFINGMNRVVGPMRIQYAPPQLVTVDSDRTAAFQAKIQEVAKDQELICMIFPNNKADRYHALKKLLCCDIPVPSQVVLSKTLQKGKSNLAVCTKVAGQINCKLGGALWRTTIPVKGIMICGFDTYHDSKLKGRSVGALVASLDQNCIQYFSTANYHSTREEITANMEVSMTKCLDAYYAVQGKYPEKVIVYRDGVGEGQIPQVKNIEVELVKKVIAGKTGLQVKMAYIIVSKRINTRIFQFDGRGELMNPNPGTVVDDVITCPESNDFFLISQSVRQGTVCPTMYNIIEDTGVELEPDHFQLLTYRLTHMYFNWPGTVRVPAHCQLAHKKAFLTGQSLHREADLSLLNKQYYL